MAVLADQSPYYWNLTDQVPGFWPTDLEAQRFKALLKASRITSYQDGEVILKEDKAAQPWLYFLLAGQVALLNEGKVQEILKRRGDAFGATEMIGASTPLVVAQAVGDTSCFSVNASQVRQVTGDDKMVFGCVIYRLFAETINASLRTANQNLAEAYQEIERLKADLEA